MSWSINFTGNRKAIENAIEATSSELSGESKSEFDLAKPHLLGLLSLNYNQKNEMIICVSANGHTYRFNDEQYVSNCNVSISPFNSNFVQ